MSHYTYTGRVVMAHQLDFVQTAKGREARMFYAGDLPWHGLGQKLDGVATWEQAVAAAHLGYEVGKVPLAYAPDPMRQDYRQTRYFGLLNMDTIGQPDADVFGVVTKEYEVLQNADLFDFFDPIVAKGEAIFHTAGALFGGMKVWCLAKLPQEIVVAGKDRIDQYVLLSNAHDGTTAIRIQYTPIRVVCNNTLTAAENSGADRVVTIRHGAKMKDALAQAHQLLGILTASDSKVLSAFNYLASKQATVARARDYFIDLYPPARASVNETAEQRNTREHRERARLDGLLARFEYGPGAEQPGIRGTMWSAYNAVTHYIDHRHNARYRADSKSERRMDSLLFGEGHRTRVMALDKAFAFAGN